MLAIVRIAEDGATYMGSATDQDLAMALIRTIAATLGDRPGRIFYAIRPMVAGYNRLQEGR